MNLTGLNAALGSMLELLQAADATPTTQAVAASGELRQTMTNLLTRWSELKSKDLSAINEQLRQASLPPLNP